MSVNASHEIVVPSKKYTFNPLSEPFHPMKTVHFDTTYPTISVTTSSSESGQLANQPVTSPATNVSSAKADTGEFICILCPKKCATLDELNKHIENKVHQPYVCEKCGGSYAHFYLLQRHMKNHSCIGKTFRCRGCGKKFRNLNQLGKHFEFCRFNLYMFI